jgi:hypothetical protein
MLTAVVIINLLISVVCFYIAAKVGKIRRTIAGFESGSQQWNAAAAMLSATRRISLLKGSKVPANCDGAINNWNCNCNRFSNFWDCWVWAGRFGAGAIDL